MVARNKSKKTTSSKTKKTGAASSAKPTSKRPEGDLFIQRPKSSQQEQAGVEYSRCAQNESKLSEPRRKLPRRNLRNESGQAPILRPDSCNGRGKEAGERRQRKAAASKSLSKTTKTAAAAKRASAARAHLKEQEAKLSTGNRSAAGGSSRRGESAVARCWIKAKFRS